jgi:hypothetical protein
MPICLPRQRVLQPGWRDPLRWRPMRALGLVIIVALLAGCSFGGDDGAAVDAGQLQQLVLQPEDVSREFERFDEGRQLAVEQRIEGGDFDRLEGWKARYRRSGTPATEGPLVIASLADAFESASGAEDAFAELRSSLDEGDPGWEPVETPTIGDEAVARTVEEGSGPSRVRFFTVLWRQANITASVEVNGFADRIDVNDAVELARKQAARIERAAS